MYHTSPTKIEKGTINAKSAFHCAADCLFFSNEIYRMTESKEIFIYEADFNCVHVSELSNHDVINDIANYFDCDADLAESLLDGTANEWDYGADGDDSWWLQGQRGLCAKKMGYDGCEDEDEQGTVYIVPMSGREEELTLIN